MEDINDGIVASVPSPKNKMICPKMPGKWSFVIMGVAVLLMAVSFYFLYRHISSVNKRFHSLEDLLSKVIDKTNQLQHVIQSGYAIPAPVPHQASVRADSPVMTPQQTAPPPINLDKELAEELKELDSSTKTSSTDKEGRVDDESKN